MFPLEIPPELIVTVIAYPILAAAILWGLRGNVRRAVFGLFNVAGAFVLMAGAMKVGKTFGGDALFKDVVLKAAPLFAVYLACVLLDYGLLRVGTARGGRLLLAAFLAPIVELVLFKVLPSRWHPFIYRGVDLSQIRLSVFLLGSSYLCFRLSYLVQEVQNETVEMPNLWDYLSFAFFVPTLSVGPISPYAKFASYLKPPDRQATPIGRSLERIAVGMWKYVFLCALMGPLTYSGLLTDGHTHGLLDLVIAVFSFTGYLYFNFSGMCDIAVGVSGLLGIQVIENFDRPFEARNLQVFWTKWHISLTNWLRDMMFTPLVKVLMRAWGPKQANHAIAVAIMVVFITIGLWHGSTLNFLLFGLSQGLGVCFNHYSTIFLRKRLGKEGYARYRDNAWIRSAACLSTFVYFSLSLFLWTNTVGDMAKIAKAVTLR